MSISPRYSSLRFSVAVLALTGMVACSQADSATTSELERDLEQTKVAEMEMAGANGARTDVVSGIERVPVAPKPVPIAAPIPEKPPVLDPLPDAVVPSTRPRPNEAPKPTRKGPYKSTSTVIRNAPFPINP